MRAARTFALLLAVAALLALMAVPAGAVRPFQVRISDPVSILLPGEDFCGFDVQAEVEQKFKFIEFSGRRGTAWTAMTVGKLKAVLTNSDTGESIALSIPGPGFIDANGNTIVGTGPWVVFVPGQLLYLVGRITFVPGPFGVQPDVVRGRTIDLCDVLAP
jgi:hypothetical protein